MENKIERKNVIWNIIGATTNSFTSLIFAIIATRINGVDEAGIFSYAFATACIFYVIAVYAGRTFQVTDISGKFSDMDYIYHRIITCIIMMLGIVLFTTIKGYNLFKITVMVLLCLYRGVEAFSEAWYAILQKNKCLYQVGISMTIKAVGSVLLFFIVDYVTHNLILACTCIVIANLLGVIFYDIKNIRKVGIEKTAFNIKNIKSIFILGFFTFILTFLGIYLINASRYAIDDYLSNDLQTIFGIIIMPATFMGLLGQYIIQPCLIKITDYIKNKEYINLRKIILSFIAIIVILGILVIIVAYFLEAPILKIIYGIELKPYFSSMMIIIVGSILYSLSTILSAVLIAMRKTFYQSVIYFITSIIATVFAYIAVNKMGIVGASINYFVSMFIVAITFLIYIAFQMRKYKKEWLPKR